MDLDRELCNHTTWIHTFFSSARHGKSMKPEGGGGGAAICKVLLTVVSNVTYKLYLNCKCYCWFEFGSKLGCVCASSVSLSNSTRLTYKQPSSGNQNMYLLAFLRVVDLQFWQVFAIFKMCILALITVFITLKQYVPKTNQIE